jgi:hypothetical protein
MRPSSPQTDDTPDRLEPDDTVGGISIGAIIRRKRLAYSQMCNT